MTAAGEAYGELSREVADASSDIICFIDRDLRIVHCNPAWDEFALANRGESALASRVVGRPLFDFIPLDLQSFYRMVFDACAADGQPFSFDYECSSRSVFRLFRMSILPQRKQGGFAAVHCLRVETRHTRHEFEPSPQYFSPQKTITLCVHCRRTRREDDTSRWDWVPGHLDTPGPAVNHSLCLPCRSYFYGLTQKPVSSSALMKKHF